MGRHKKASLEDISAIEHKYSRNIKASSNIDMVEEQLADLKTAQAYSRRCNDLIEKIQYSVYDSMIDALKNKTIKTSGQVLQEQPNSGGISIAELAKKYKKCAQTIINKLEKYKIKSVGKRGKAFLYDIPKDMEYVFEDERAGKNEEMEEENTKGMTVNDIKKKYGVSEPTIYARKEEGLIKEIGKKGKAVLYEVSKDAFLKKKKN